jgi:hypothetical protein
LANVRFIDAFIILPHVLRALSRFAPCKSAIGADSEQRGPQEKKKPGLESGTAPRLRDLQLLAVPSFSTVFDQSLARL